MDAQLAANTRAMRRLIGGLSAQLQELLDVVAGIRRGTAAARVAGMLGNLAGGATEPVTLSITQQELAELLGLTRATVNAALRSMEASGLIERGYGTITVNEPTAIRLVELD